MRTYFEPEMKIAVFDVINCAISSDNVEGNFTPSTTNAVYGKDSLDNMMKNESGSIPATMN